MSRPGDRTELGATGQPPAWAWAPPAPVVPDPPPRPGRVAAAMAVVAGAVAASGALFGLLWSAVAPDVPLRMTERGPVFGEPQPEQLAAADGWFALLGLPFGGLLAVGVWLLARRVRGVPALLALIAGAAGAALLAWGLGRQVGLAGYEEAVAQAAPGAALARPPDLAVTAVGWWPPHVAGVLLVPALAAAVTYTLLAAWSQFATLRPEHPPQDPHNVGDFAGLDPR